MSNEYENQGKGEKRTEMRINSKRINIVNEFKGKWLNNIVQI